MILKKIAVTIYQELCGIPQIFICILNKLLHPHKSILLKGFFIFKGCKLANFNWGDDINYYFIKDMTKAHVALLPDTKIAKILPISNYLCIGSTIMSFDMKKTIVWGAGLLNDKMGFKVKSKPQKVLAVRGPLTRKWLLEQGIECPEIYGDPALLLPQFYNCKKNIKYKMGIIPHYIDMDSPIVKKIIKEDGVKFIKISGYSNWHDFVKEINECEFVVSSSLHGVIVSEAYGVPVLWVKFDEDRYVEGWDFKFHDFYESIHKNDMNYININNMTTYKDLRNICDQWEKADINVEKLLKSCPFELDFSLSSK